MQLLKQSTLSTLLAQQQTQLQSIQRQQQDLQVTVSSLLNEQQLALLDQLHEKSGKTTAAAPTQSSRLVKKPT